MKARQYTKEEVVDNFLSTIRQYTFYWSRQEDLSEREKLDGVAFSVLCILDGVSSLPAFSVVPMPHPDDQHFHMSEGDNYYPFTPDNLLENDIGGDLHERWSRDYAKKR